MSICVENLKGRHLLCERGYRFIAVGRKGQNTNVLVLSEEGHKESGGISFPNIFIRPDH